MAISAENGIMMALPSEFACQVHCLPPDIASDVVGLGVSVGVGGNVMDVEADGDGVGHGKLD